ncbi:MAG: ATP-binding protein [Defluviitaleaceae bacterium]|nr:ATP-binding protein [Defluviitaleaceae bacterium]
MYIILPVLLIFVLIIAGIIVYLGHRAIVLTGELNEVNASYIEIVQEREHQQFMVETVDYMSFSLLGIPDNDLERFDKYLLTGIQTVAVSGSVDTIGVYRNNKDMATGEWLSETQLSWDREVESVGKAREQATVFSYAKLPGWYEKLEGLEIINASVADFTDEERQTFDEKAQSVLIVPVYFQERFWGTVWFEDFTNKEAFDSKRVSLLRSAAFMLISAAHRKRLAVRVQEANNRMRLMLDAMPISCFVWGSSGKIIDVNITAVKFFGFKSREELMDRYNEASPVFQPGGKRSDETLLEYLKIALSEGEFHFEWVHRLPSTNDIVPTEVSYIRVNYDGEDVVAGYIRDIREHKRMVDEIKHHSHLLYTVNAAATTLLQSEPEEFDVSLFRSLTMMARSVDVERIFVWEYGELGTFNQIYEWVGDSTIFQRQNKKIESGDDSAKFETRLLRGLCISGLSRELPDDTRKAFLLDDTISYLIIPTFLRGKLWGIVGFGDLRKERDFTENEESVLRSGGLLMANALLRNEMTQNIRTNSIHLSEALQAAQSASSAKSNFLSTMSHEMRTPMNAIIGMSAVGRDSSTLERKDYAFDQIVTAGNHLLGVINDILDMSKIEAGMLTLTNEAFTLGDVIDNVLTIIRFRINEKKQKFSLKKDPKLPEILVADSQRLTQVLTNLLSNACKFTDEGLGVRLEIMLENKSFTDCIVRFDVIDEGIGLSERQQSKLFNSFVQAEASTSRKFGGTGLGLAISKHIVELMGGDIWVESRLGEGSIFSFTVKARLPDREELKKLRAAEDALNDHVTFPGRCILLAEDVAINREIIEAMLEDTRLEIVCAENGVEAYEIYEKDPARFDLIFMDVHMPILDGYQTTKKIRAMDNPLAKKVPIVAMTANVFREDIDKCMESGMDDHVGKPVNLSHVYEVLKKYL